MKQSRIWINSVLYELLIFFAMQCMPTSAQFSLFLYIGYSSYASPKMIMGFLYSMHILRSSTEEIKIDGEKALQEYELYMEYGQKGFGL